MPVPFQTGALYALDVDRISCSAFLADDAQSCEAWLKGDVAARVSDIETLQGFDDELEALKSEGFDPSVLQSYQRVEPPEPTYGDVGESIADLFLMERFGAHLPSNRRWDLRTPKGSHPGSDIAGYMKNEDGTYTFLFGEVKASSEQRSPPSVMTHTASGMVAQLKRIATKTEIRKQLFMYLRRRQHLAPYKEAYDSALRQLAQARYELWGVLVRDTAPNQADVEASMHKLRDGILAPQTCRLFVLHTSIRTSDWLLHCKIRQA